MIAELFTGQNEYIIRLIVAACLGGLVGIERDIHGRAAGLRTHLLVSMGAAVYMILSEQIAFKAVSMAPHGAIQAFADPGRIAAQVVTGIGFLGAGMIIKEGLSIRGLTTAACIWTVAGIGMASGAGYYPLAGMTTAISLIALISLHYFERWYPKDSYRILSIDTSIDVDTTMLLTVVAANKVRVMYIDVERNFDQQKTSLKLHLRLFHRGLTDRLCHGIIQSLEEADIPLHRVRWHRQ